jgi:septal ring factor EnvC (AmiA/AmiB activator)
MKKNSSHPVRVLLAICLASLPYSALCGEPTTTVDAAEIQARLKQLKSDIEKFTDQLEDTKGKRAGLESELKQNEKDIGEIIKKIDVIEEDLDDGEDKISDLQKRQRELVIAKEEQQDYIVQHIRAAYQIGNQEYVKVLLNQEDPSKIARMLVYYDYINKARAQQIERYSATIASLAVVERDIVRQTEKLARDRSRLQNRHIELAKIRQQRGKTLLRRNATIVGKVAELKILISDRQRLEELLTRIERDIAFLPTPSQVIPFARLKGKMILPAVGKISNRFGSPLTRGKLSWNGLFIAAAEGQPVYAVHYGRVVFSGWLRGFGLLLIINHGEGYMSLYGHNQSLHREIGDWVDAGEIIASTGNSGGLPRSGLYFEIRYGGKPRDPQIWCIARA